MSSATPLKLKQVYQKSDNVIEHDILENEYPPPNKQGRNVPSGERR